MLSPTTQRTISRYLERYAEPEARNIQAFIGDTCYEHCVVIPLFHETSDSVERLIKKPLSHKKPHKKILAIVIINQPDDDRLTEPSLKNINLWNTFTKAYPTINKSAKHHWLGSAESAYDLLLIDRFHQPIPKKQGVGLARKIGADIACQLIIQQRLPTLWVHHTDGDTYLPDDYFSAVETFLTNASDKTVHFSAAVYPFKHQPSGEEPLDTATQWYDNSLHHYVEGLERAGSPYAHHTIGSCIATQMGYYCQARGFPKKAGGEDFYLLNKLAKLAPIAKLDSSPLLIESRVSTRVPFGTGPAVDKIMQLMEASEEYRYYHPMCFTELKTLLSAFDTLFSHREEHSTLLKSHETLKSSDLAVSTWLLSFSPALQQALQVIGIEKLFKHIDRQVQSHSQCIHHCHIWLDGFKTLKIIHALEYNYPKRTAAEITILSKNKTL